MGIFKRINDIISANLNEMTEGFENPEKLLKQAIREMDDSIADATTATAKALANEKVLTRELASNEGLASKWQSRAEQAVQSGDDELARKALRRKHEHEKLVVALEDQIEAARVASRGLKRQLEAMKAKRSEAKRNLATLSARQRAAEFRQKMQTVGAETSTELDNDAFAKFDRLRTRVEQAEAVAEAMAELQETSDACTVDLEDAFVDEADADLDVDAELAALKRKTG